MYKSYKDWPLNFKAIHSECGWYFYHHGQKTEGQTTYIVEGYKLPENLLRRYRELNTKYGIFPNATISL